MSRLSVLHLFAGLSGYLAEAGRDAACATDAEDVDIKSGVDVLRPNVQESLCARADFGEFDGGALIGLPCDSFAVALGADGTDEHVLRTWDSARGGPDGITDGSLTEAQLRKLQVGNQLVLFTVRLVRILRRRGVPVIIESRADRSDPDSPAWWPERAHLPPVWAHSAMAKLLSELGLQLLVFPQCAFGRGPHGKLFQKFTQIACSAEVAARLAGLRLLRCGHGHGEHDPTTGVDEHGDNCSAATAAYPWQQCRMLLYGLTGRRTADTLIGVDRHHEHVADFQTRDGGAALAALPDAVFDSDSDSSLSDFDEDEDEGSPPEELSFEQFTALARTDASAELVRLAAAAARAQAASAAGGAVSEDDAQRAADFDARGPALLDAVAGRTDAGGGDSIPPTPPGAPASSVLRARIAHGGHVTDGPSLAPPVAAAVEAARVAPPKWASVRNLEPASPAEMLARPAPTPLRSEQSAPESRVQAADHGAVLARGRAACGGNIAIEQLWLPGKYEEVQAWLSKARRGKKMRTTRWGQECLVEWARGLVWDSSDPTNCVPLGRSTRHTVFPGDKQLDRANLREAARELGWDDDNTLLQGGEGGTEIASSCSLSTVLATHHSGVWDHFDAAKEAVDKEEAEQWASLGSIHPPTVPVRVNPRDVIMQERSRPLPSGVVEHYQKPRITMNLSHEVNKGDKDSVNAGISADDRSMTMPSPRTLGHGLAHAQNAFDRAGVDVDGYCIDCEAAYSFCVVQSADVWLCSYLWWRDDGTAVIKQLWRVGFGGGNSPRRFMGISRMSTALVAKRQREFDATAPFPPEVEQWRGERRELQRRGSLPDGPEHVWPAACQIYLDDAAGGGGADEVEVPAGFELAPSAAHPLGTRGVAVGGVDAGELATEAAGGVTTKPGTRVAVYLAIMVRTLEWLGFKVSIGKTEAGSIIVNLGLRFDLRRRRIDCPLPKRTIMLDSISMQRAAALSGELERRPVDKLVGRLGHLAQAMPEMVPWLQGGYKITNAARRGRDGELRLLAKVPLSQGGKAQTAFCRLLGIGESLIDANDGIPLAAAARFRAVGSAGTLTITTDASGDVADAGIGGYGHLPSLPGVLFALSEDWWEPVSAALLQSSLRARDRSPGAQRCSMPAAELFGAWALAEAIADRHDVQAVIAIGDCQPAAAALNAASSVVPQMHQLLVAARERLPRWLGVAIPRELNVDADRLSHPSGYAEVEAEAVAAGWRVERLAIPHRCRTTLESALDVDAGSWVEAGGDWRLR